MERRKSPSMQSDRVTSRVKDHPQQITEKTKMRKTDTDFRGGGMNNSYD